MPWDCMAVQVASSRWVIVWIRVDIVFIDQWLGGSPFLYWEKIRSSNVGEKNKGFCR